MKTRLLGILSGILICVALGCSCWAASLPPDLNVTSWAYQLEGIDVDQVVSDDSFQLIVMDYSATGGAEGKFTPEQIDRIRQAGKKAIAYLSIGEAESYRSYWNPIWESNPPAWLGPENPNWLGNYKVRFWDPAWQTLIFAYLDEIYDQGFDGIYCDIIDAYYFWREENPEKPDADALMAQFIIDLRKHVSDRGDRPFAILIQNGETLIDEVNITDSLRDQIFEAIDGIGVEDLFFSGDQEDNNPYQPETERLPYLREFLGKGKTVLSVEYLTDPSLIRTFLIEAEKEGFVPYTTTRALDTLFPGVEQLDPPMALNEVRYWAYQIQGLHLNNSASSLAQSDYDMLVLDPTRTDWSSDAKFFDTPSVVSTLKRSKASDGIHRKLVIAYVDIGQAEDWRWYWKWSKEPWLPGSEKPSDWPDYIITQDPDGWGGNYPVAYWDPAWKDVVLYGSAQSSLPHGTYVSMVDELIIDGFDGIYMDWVEGFENERVMARAQQEGKDPAAEMIAFIGEIRAYARQRNPDFLVIQQNAAALAQGHPELLIQIDGLAQEAIWFDGQATDDWADPSGRDRRNEVSLSQEYLTQLQVYQSAGLPVFACEYALDYAHEAYRLAATEGFIPYVTRRSLSQLSSTPPPEWSSAFRALLPPPSGSLYHGIYPGGATDAEDNITLEGLLEYEQLAGKSAAWVYFSHNWFHSRSFPVERATWIREAGSIPFIRLMLRSDEEQGRADPTYTLDRILGEEFDMDLRDWARNARAFASPLIVEYGTEMNGEWFPWNGRWNGKGELTGYGDPTFPDGPERFRDAYRHIIGLFREEQADNITWVFHVNDSDIPEEEWNQMELYYPGDDWIDWIGVSVYGASTPLEAEWFPFRTMMDELDSRLIAQWPGKPIALLEFGVTQGNPLGNQADWADAALSDIVQLRWPRLIGFSWWNESWQNDDEPSHDTTMRLQDNPALAQAFQKWVGQSGHVLGAPLFDTLESRTDGATRITPVAYDAFGHFIFSWNSTPGLSYEIQFKEDLNSMDWELLETRVATGDSSSYEDERDGHSDRGFYRIILLE